MLICEMVSHCRVQHRQPPPFKQRVFNDDNEAETQRFVNTVLPFYILEPFASGLEHNLEFGFLGRDGP